MKVMTLFLFLFVSSAGMLISSEEKCPCTPKPKVVAQDEKCPIMPRPKLAATDSKCPIMPRPKALEIS